ncbi:MAG: hypothetical protein KAQ98_11665 [Bacteriovoracaceae bacterium]|nr:hypothetical protein [Bacteriovoracaceae bacterium]
MQKNSIKNPPPRLVAQFHLIQAIRNFFNDLGFLDVMTPPAVPNPGMETHIHPFQLKSVFAGRDIPLYLHTSPEFCMKELLSNGFNNIFNISYCFRDEPDTPVHRKQFLMLEWYRRNERYEKIMDDCENLIKYSLEYLKKKNITINTRLAHTDFQRATIQEIFQEHLHINILDYLEKNDLRELIQKDFKEVPLPMNQNLSWDDYYFLLFLNKIEPHLAEYPYLLLYEFPHHLSALSTIKKDDPGVCERFEIYIDGIELCNCFNELCDLEIQKKRFDFQQKEKKKLYHYELPTPNILYNALENGLPCCAGIALGIERFLKALTCLDNTFWK